MMFKLFRRAGVLAAALVLTACGGGGSTEEGPALSGGVVKGPVLGATVCAWQLASGVKGAQLALTLPAGATGSVVSGCFVTAANGNYDVRLPAGASGDVLLEATGGSFCSNEEPVANGACTGGTLVELGAAVMTSAVTLPGAGGSATVYTTPLTTAAVNAAAGASFSAATFNSRFATLAGQVVGAASNVTAATAPTAANQPYLAQVSAYLAGGGTFGNVLSALAQGSTNFTSPGAGTDPDPDPGTGSGTGANGTTSAATVHASLVGTHALQFHAGSGAGCGSSCSYTDGQSVEVTVHGDGRLGIPGKVLTNPFFRHYGGGAHTPEVIWLDAEAQVEYALTDNSTGTFSEINVGNAAQPSSPFGIPAFLGQLRAPQAAGAVDAALAAWAGTYPIAYQYTGPAVPWTSVTLAADGSITFNGGAGPNLTAANIVEKFDRLSCCGRIDLQVNLDLNGNGVTSADVVSLYKDNTGALRSIKYETGNEAQITDDVGVRLGTVEPLVHAGTAIPADKSVHGTVGGSPLDFAVTFGNVTPNQLSLEAAEGSGTARTWLLQVFSGANLQAGTSYNCRYDATVSNRINVRTVAGGSLLTTDQGGRCTITLTAFTVSGGVVTLAEGTFTAEFVDFSQASVPLTVTNGVFRYVP